MKWLKDHPFALVLLLVLLIFLPHLGVLPVNIMEARNFITAREMLTDGNWLHTTLNGFPRYEKPPLPTWLTAIAGAAGGLQQVWVLRLPAVLVLGFLLFMTRRLSFEWTGDSAYAATGIIVLSTSFFMTWSGRNGQWDIFTHGFMMGAIYFLYLWIATPQHAVRNAALAAFFIGCSFMSKGPVSVYALLLPFLISWGIVYRFRHPVTGYRKISLRAFLVFAVIAVVTSGWWHLYIYLSDPIALHEITSREVNNWHSYNVRPWYYYWDFFLQSGLWSVPSVFGLMYFYLRHRVSDKKAYTFTFIWVVTAVILLSLIPEKKSRYLLPVLIPLSLNTAFYLEYLFRTPRENQRNTDRWFNRIHHGLLAIVALCIPIIGYFFPGEYPGSLKIWFLLLSAAGIGTGVLMWRSLVRRDIRTSFLCSLLLMISLIIFGLPLSRAIMSNPEYKDLSELPLFEEATGMRTYAYKEIPAEMVWSYGDKIPVLPAGDIGAVPGKDFRVLVAEEDQQEFFAEFRKFDLRKETFYNMSAHGKGEKRFNSRLYRDLYLVRHKQAGTL